ncbi:DNA translocase FtsK, partial [Bacillus pfraonensis]
MLDWMKKLFNKEEHQEEKTAMNKEVPKNTESKPKIPRVNHYTAAREAQMASRNSGVKCRFPLVPDDGFDEENVEESTHVEKQPLPRVTNMERRGPRYVEEPIHTFVPQQAEREIKPEPFIQKKSVPTQEGNRRPFRPTEMISPIFGYKRPSMEKEEVKTEEKKQEDLEISVEGKSVVDAWLEKKGYSLADFSDESFVPSEKQDENLDHQQQESKKEEKSVVDQWLEKNGYDSERSLSSLEEQGKVDIASDSRPFATDSLLHKSVGQDNKKEEHNAQNVQIFRQEPDVVVLSQDDNGGNEESLQGQLQDSTVENINTTSTKEIEYKKETEEQSVENAVLKENVIEEKVEVVEESETAPEVEVVEESETAPEVEVVEESETAPEVEVVEESETAPEVEVVEESETAPEVEVAEESETAPEVEVVEESETAPEVEVVEESETAPEVEVVEESETAPEVEVVEESETAPEVEVVEESETAPEVEVVEESETAPEVEVVEESETAPEVEVAEESETAPEVEVVEESETAPEVEVAEENETAPEVEVVEESETAPEVEVAEESETTPEVEVVEEPAEQEKFVSKAENDISETALAADKHTKEVIQNFANVLIEEAEEKQEVALEQPVKQKEEPKREKKRHVPFNVVMLKQDRRKLMERHAVRVQTPQTPVKQAEETSQVNAQPVQQVEEIPQEKGRTEQQVVVETQVEEKPAQQVVVETQVEEKPAQQVVVETQVEEKPAQQVVVET